jgi:hypothetical protein
MMDLSGWTATPAMARRQHPNAPQAFCSAKYTLAMKMWNVNFTGL